MKIFSILLFCAASAVSLPAVAHDEVAVAQFPGSLALADDLTHTQSVFLKEVRFPDGTVCVVAKAGNTQTPMALSCEFKDHQDPQERH